MRTWTAVTLAPLSFGKVHQINYDTLCYFEITEDFTRQLSTMMDSLAEPDLIKCESVFQVNILSSN